MKKLILAVIVIGCVVYGGTVMYLNGFDHKTAPVLAENSPLRHDKVAMAAFDVLKEARCDYCHAEKVNLPFYFKLPIANTLMEQDRVKGLRNFRMEPVLAAMNEGKPVSLSALSRIEFVMQRNLMPPSLYLLMHWHSRLSAEQRDAVIKWVKQERKQYYSTQGVAERFASEPVQPIPESLPVDPKVVALGKKLFFEKRLSGDNSLSCASCHDLQKGGADGLVTATGINGQKGPINVPTVYNAVFNHSQFWDGRAADLEEQAAGPVMNPLEMGSTSWEEVANKLRQEPSYEKEFEAAFGSPVIDKKTITDAIGAYEKTLITPDSPFDMYLKGVEGAINTQAKRGYQLFKDNGCASCHNGVALGGAAYEELGLQSDYFKDRGGKLTDADQGRFNVTHNTMDKHAFKVPLLRNIALTGPYFHDGSVTSLKVAVEKMLKYQTPFHKLSDQEVDDIVAFLKTLTGKYQGQPIDKLAP
ncbi:cytochrome-c peroxidase [Commensalibacter oyaizuii]|uniref:Cytochrome-c peroxidase n=1 Tax=Commensalibacter oyaizuii TaxID=3043873 RepID=A0ABT6PYS7_9PROT|nr:cytochrome-c peroxidase [Commensalibacter sp. TBRC 16381]MDI2090016.1 cytochrome-c peroxidase [Commensalibacter sp. TBRC 16381]